MPVSHRDSAKKAVIPISRAAMRQLDQTKALQHCINKYYAATRLNAIPLNRISHQKDNCVAISWPHTAVADVELKSLQRKSKSTTDR